MLDVIHVFYEEDITPRWEQETEVKDKMREQLYQLLYNRKYRYGQPSGTGGFGSGETPDMPTETDLPPEAFPTKEYFPPTDPEDFAAVLKEPPMG